MYVYLTQILGVASPCCYLLGKGFFIFYFCYEKEVGLLTHDILNASRQRCPTSRDIHFLFSTIKGLKREYRQSASNFEFTHS